jgi:hypothetical protein
LTKLSNKRLSFWIAIVYVGLGTIYSFSYWTYPIIGTFGDILFGFFFPVSFFPIVVFFTERKPFFYLLVSQTIVLLAIWTVMYRLIHFFRKEKSASDRQASNTVDNNESEKRNTSA